MYKSWNGRSKITLAFVNGRLLSRRTVKRARALLCVCVCVFACITLTVALNKPKLSFASEIKIREEIVEKSWNEMGNGTLDKETKRV